MNKREASREETQQQLLRAALELFAEEGFSSTSMRAIAKAAGVSPGLSYHYYPSKESLLQAILAQGAADVFSTFTTAGGDTELTLPVLLNNIVSLVKTKKEFWRLLHAIRLQRSLVHLLGKEVEGLQTAILEQLRHLPEVRRAPNPILQASVLFASIDGAVLHYLTYEHYPLQDVFNNLQILFNPNPL